MKLKAIKPAEINVQIYDIWHKKWMLLTCGDFEKSEFNTMTVGWGSLGVMWNKPFVQVVVRDSRYTFEFMELFDTFTLTAFPDEYRPALQLLGSKSGRDGDKIKEAGLTPVSSVHVPSPAFEEAELIISCRKIYQDDMDPAKFKDAAIHEHYPDKDYHRIYFGEIVGISGTDDYL